MSIFEYFSISFLLSVEGAPSLNMLPLRRSLTSKCILVCDAKQARANHFYEIKTNQCVNKMQCQAHGIMDGRFHLRDRSLCHVTAGAPTHPVLLPDLLRALLPLYFPG